jgi:hypothetical protein
MATEFIGYTVLVTLREPPNAQIQGVVSDVINQKLFLRNGRNPMTLVVTVTNVCVQ